MMIHFLEGGIVYILFKSIYIHTFFHSWTYNDNYMCYSLQMCSNRKIFLTVVFHLQN